MEQIITCGADRYNPELLPKLEAHVEEQVQSQTYNLEANLCLLRLYQFYPERGNARVLSQVLLKGLMQLPNPDCDLYLHLVPERVQQEEPFNTIINLASMLSGARFREFWQAYGTAAEMLDSVPGFKEGVRSYIMHVIGSTYQNVPTTVIEEVMGLASAEVPAFIASQSGLTVNGDLLQLPANEDNHPVAKNSVESISFHQIVPCLALGLS